MGNPSLAICVTLLPEARRKLDQLLRTPRSRSSVKQKMYQEWAGSVLHRELGLDEEASVDPFAEFRHVPSAHLPVREQKILELYRQGLSFNQIARTLNDENVPTRKGGTWRHRTVQLVLERIRKDYPPVN